MAFRTPYRGVDDLTKCPWNAKWQYLNYYKLLKLKTNMKLLVSNPRRFLGATITTQQGDFFKKTICLP